MPASSRWAPLFLALRCISIGLGALRGLRLLHLALLPALFWSGRLVGCSLISGWARAELSVNARRRNQLCSSVAQKQKMNMKYKQSCHLTCGTGARICAVEVAAIDRPLPLRSFALQPHPDRSSRQNVKRVLTHLNIIPLLSSNFTEVFKYLNLLNYHYSVLLALLQIYFNTKPALHS